MSDHYVCMGCGGHPDYSCYEHEGKFYCGPCFDNAKLESKNAELSALRAEVERLTTNLTGATFGLDKMTEKLIAAEAEVTKLRKVADAAREYREAEKKYGGGADPIYASAVCQSGLALDAALAGLGEPTPEPPSEP